MTKKIATTVIAALICASVLSAGAAVIRTNTNEVNILNIYNALSEIKAAIEKLNNKIDEM